MKSEIHIGREIKRKMDEDGRKTKWLAEKINCDRTNIDRIYQHKHIDPELLMQICIHLEIDLFSLYSQRVCEEIQKKRDNV